MHNWCKRSSIVLLLLVLQISYRSAVIGNLGLLTGKNCLILRGDRLRLCYAVIAVLSHLFIGMSFYLFFTCFDHKCGRENESWISFLMECCCNTSSSWKYLEKGMNFFFFFKGVDESGADKFTVLFPSGTPLPARRQHTLHAPGNTSSVCLELYESLGEGPMNEEGKFAQVSMYTFKCTFNISRLEIKWIWGKKITLKWKPIPPLPKLFLQN